MEIILETNRLILRPTLMSGAEGRGVLKKTGLLNTVKHTSNALEADTLKKIEKSYRMNKTGVWEAPEI